MKNNMKKVMTATAFTLACFSIPTFASQAYSMQEKATNYVSFNTTVGKLNGSGYSTYQTKTTSGANGEVLDFYNGGYACDVRINNSNGNGAWTRQKTSGYFQVDSHISHTSGSNVRLQISNNISTLVNTQASGLWRSN